VPERTGPGDTAQRWTKILHEGGYFVEPQGRSHPAALALAGLPPLLQRLEAAEEGIVLGRHPIAWLTGAVPRHVYGGMALVFLVFAMAWGTLVAMAGSALTFGLAGLVGLGFAVGQDVQRRRFGRACERERGRLGRQIHASVAEIAASTFVLRCAGVLAVGAPHRTWLTHRIRDLRRAREPEPPPGWDELATALEAEVERMDDALLRASFTGPPTPEALTADVRTLAARFDAFQVQGEAEGAWLDRRLRAAAN
jgi:hypothetical protein